MFLNNKNKNHKNDCITELKKIIYVETTQFFDSLLKIGVNNVV